VFIGVLCCQNDPNLYFIDDHTIKCAAVDSLNQPNPTFQTVVSNLAEGAAIDIDVRNRMIYWSDTQAWTINRMNLTSGEVKVIIKDNIGEVYSIAVEWESGLIYWTDLIFERIEVAKLNGSSRRTLITKDVESPMGIAVDPGNGLVDMACSLAKITLQDQKKYNSLSVSFETHVSARLLLHYASLMTKLAENGSEL